MRGCVELVNIHGALRHLEGDIRALLLALAPADTSFPEVCAGETGVGLRQPFVQFNSLREAVARFQ